MRKKNNNFEFKIAKNDVHIKDLLISLIHAIQLTDSIRKQKVTPILWTETMFS